jgi:hypothetical protein
MSDVADDSLKVTLMDAALALVTAAAQDDANSVRAIYAEHVDHPQLLLQAVLELTVILVGRVATDADPASVLQDLAAEWAENKRLHGDPQ